MSHVWVRIVLSVAWGVAGAAFAQTPDSYQRTIPIDAVEAVRQGRDARRDGKVQEAQRLLKPVVVEYPEYLMGQYQLGLAYQEANDTERALVHLKEAARLNTALRLNEPTVNNALGALYLQAKNYDLALVEYLQAATWGNLRQLDTAAQKAVLNNVGVAYSYLGRPCDAEIYYTLIAVVTSEAVSDLVQGSWRIKEWEAKSVALTGTRIVRRGDTRTSGILRIAKTGQRLRGELTLCAKLTNELISREIVQEMTISGRRGILVMTGRVTVGSEYWGADIFKLIQSGEVLRGNAGDGSNVVLEKVL